MRGTDVLDEIPVRIEQVEQRLGVRAMRRREHHDLEELGDALEEVLHVRPLLHLHRVLNAIEVHLKTRAVH